MPRGIVALWLIALALFSMQAVGGILQIRNYQKAIARARRHGATGVGQRRSRFVSGQVVVAACNRDHIVTYVEVLDGVTIVARFRRVREVGGHPLEGTTFEKHLEWLRSLDEKRQRKLGGYLEAFTALEIRFENERLKEQGMISDAGGAAGLINDRVYDNLDDSHDTAFGEQERCTMEA
jgi:glucitol operon activator protein